MSPSCSLNPYTKVLVNGNSSTSRVSVQIFSIVNLNVIYLHCQVQICAQIGSDTCVPVSTLILFKKKNLIQLCSFCRVNESEITNPALWLKNLVINTSFLSSLWVFSAGLSAKNISVFKHNRNSFGLFWASTEVRWRWAFSHRTTVSVVLLKREIFFCCMSLLH